VTVDQRGSLESARRIFEQELGDLPALLSKILQAGIVTGPNAPLVAAWCSQHPEAAARIVGAVAMVFATQEVAK